MIRRTAVAVAGWVGVSILPGVVGGLFRPGDWYSALGKPAWTPPGWVFGPVWTLLYVTMGVAAWLVWARAGWGWPLLPFVVQLVLNGAWTWLFFGLRSPELALLDIVALWVMILVTLIVFWRVHPVAGGLLLPYLAWVTFAGALNAAIWHLNRP
jgi:benzodiazapine receptor